MTHLSLPELCGRLKSGLLMIFFHLVWESLQGGSHAAQMPAGWRAKVLSGEHEREAEQHLPSKAKGGSSTSVHESSSEGETLKPSRSIATDKKLVTWL